MPLDCGSTRPSTVCTAIMASGAVSVAELVAEVPGIVTLMGGDYGTPVTLSAFGSGGGGFRIIRDGFEVTPLSGRLGS